MIDDRVEIIAEMEGDLFEYSCKKRECSSSFFIKQFLFSSVSKRMANILFVYCCDDIPYLYEELSKEKKLVVGKEIYPEPVMHWIGYLLAIIVHVNKVNPMDIYRGIKPKELYAAYEAYHSLDIENAANRIVESRLTVNKYDLELFKSTR